MAGLRRICRMYGGMVVNGVRYVWDYAKDEPVLETEMLPGSDRWMASEAAKWEALGKPAGAAQAEGRPRC